HRELAGPSRGAERTLPGAALLFRFEPNRRSGSDEREICPHCRAAATGRLSRYQSRLGQLEGLLTLWNCELYLRVRGDGERGRGREGEKRNPASGQVLSRSGMVGGRWPFQSKLRSFAQCRATGFDHAEHRSNRQQEACRSPHRLCAQKLGAAMAAASASVPVLMQVDGLAKRYGDQHALTDISFAVNAGEVLGLIGPNGAGKTTLMQAIAGTLAADAGHILWRGTSLSLPRRRE